MFVNNNNKLRHSGGTGGTARPSARSLLGINKLSFAEKGEQQQTDSSLNKILGDRMARDSSRFTLSFSLLRQRLGPLDGGDWLEPTIIYPKHYVSVLSTRKSVLRCRHTYYLQRMKCMLEWLASWLPVKWTKTDEGGREGGRRGTIGNVITRKRENRPTE